MKQYKNYKLLKAISLVSKEYRELKNVNQLEVNNDIKENKKVAFHIGRIETGKNNVSISTLQLLCEYFEISLSDFMKRVEEIENSLKSK
ncbi:helix-turn-helix domain-containing protein [Flavobacterium sp. SORGH_AS_0622]|uniref:helix-turn-helix domain-containing protein n=1 Tax=Flavobacterium sp. SORGH_AS_0622 TaxID=3041772 RepID=UPI0027844E61|nr:helix-turn-helix domain-containing protein [Flavobacterium sp. SORGH_AS_0622]MDQ1166388.1 transcriptional regulator with XRE-family HTH domain [Flavobacterium sp. SORGH_AS_0622]